MVCVCACIGFRVQGSGFCSVVCFGVEGCIEAKGLYAARVRCRSAVSLGQSLFEF